MEEHQKKNKRAKQSIRHKDKLRKLFHDRDNKEENTSLEDWL